MLALVEGRESKVVTLHAPDKLAGRPTHERRNGPDQSHEWTMAAAEAEDTLQWVSLHEEAVRLAERYTGELKPLAAYAVEQRFRNGGYRYRYRDDGVLQANDLSDEFLRAAVIDVAGSTATRPARVERVPNPNLPYARGDCPTPQVQWAPRGSYPFPPRDPFLRPAHIEKTVPAKTVTDIEVLVLRLSEPPVVEKVAQKAPAEGVPVRHRWFWKKQNGDCKAARERATYSEAVNTFWRGFRIGSAIRTLKPGQWQPKRSATIFARTRTSGLFCRNPGSGENNSSPLFRNYFGRKSSLSEQE